MPSSFKHHMLICLGSSCHSRGNAQNVKIVTDYINEHNLSASVDFRGHLCKEQCTKAPVIYIDNVEYANITAASLDTILNTHFNKTTCI